MNNEVLYVYQHDEVYPNDFDYNVAAQVVLDQLSTVLCTEDTCHTLSDVTRLVSSYVDKYVVNNTTEIKSVVELMVFKILSEALAKLPFSEYRLVGIKRTRSKLVFKLEEKS